LIILNPSMLTFLLDRLFSNLVKMIKIGMPIRRSNVNIAFLSFARGAPPQQDRYLACAYFRIPLGLAGNGRAIERGGRGLPPRLTSFDRRFWGQTSAIPSLLRPILSKFRR
jgi:hypothetical protein